MNKKHLTKEEIIAHYSECVIEVGSNVIDWKIEADEKITLSIEYKGFFNELAQKIFRKSRISYVHLDEKGSFLWPMFDGKTTIATISKNFSEKFGPDAEPIYERLLKYLEILENYNFIKIMTTNNSN